MLNQDIKKINNNKSLSNIIWATKSKNDNKKSNNNLDFETSFIKLNNLNNAIYAITIVGNNRSQDWINTLREL
jgi:hypothetical protein